MLDKPIFFIFFDIVLQLLSYVAERERNEIKERQRQGIDVMPIINGDLALAILQGDNNEKVQSYY